MKVAHYGKGKDGRWLVPEPLINMECFYVEARSFQFVDKQCVLALPR